MPTKNPEFDLLRKIHSIERQELGVRQAEESVRFCQRKFPEMLMIWVNELDRRRKVLDKQKQALLKEVEDAAVSDEPSAPIAF